MTMPINNEADNLWIQNRNTRYCQEVELLEWDNWYEVSQMNAAACEATSTYGSIGYGDGMRTVLARQERMGPPQAVRPSESSWP